MSMGRLRTAPETRLKDPVMHYYLRCKKYGVIQIDQARKMKDLEHKYAWLRRFMADLSLEKQVLAYVASEPCSS